MNPYDEEQMRLRGEDNAFDGIHQGCADEIARLTAALAQAEREKDEAITAHDKLVDWCAEKDAAIKRADEKYGAMLDKAERERDECERILQNMVFNVGAVPFCGPEGCADAVYEHIAKAEAEAERLRVAREMARKADLSLWDKGKGGQALIDYLIHECKPGKGG